MGGKNAGTEFRQSLGAVRRCAAQPALLGDLHADVGGPRTRFFRLLSDRLCHVGDRTGMAADLRAGCDHTLWRRRRRHHRFARLGFSRRSLRAQDADGHRDTHLRDQCRVDRSCADRRLGVAGGLALLRRLRSRGRGHPCFDDHRRADANPLAHRDNELFYRVRQRRHVGRVLHRGCRCSRRSAGAGSR